MKNFKELDVWKNAIELYALSVEHIFILRSSKYYRLAEQVESSCGSISDNIAEGVGRGGNKELIHFLYIASGSCNEYSNQISRMKLLGQLNDDQHRLLEGKALIILKQLSKFISYLSASELKGTKFK
ncbi:MAG: four helix bundle protein [Flavobacteriales bacterium]